MLKRALFRIQPIEKIRKRKRRKKEMWERSRRNGNTRNIERDIQEGAALEQAAGDGITT